MCCLSSAWCSPIRGMAQSITCKMQQDISAGKEILLTPAGGQAGHFQQCFQYTRITGILGSIRKSRRERQLWDAFPSPAPTKGEEKEPSRKSFTAHTLGTGRGNTGLIRTISGCAGISAQVSSLPCFWGSLHVQELNYPKEMQSSTSAPWHSVEFC